jgi:Lrp/AsnC family transcriptional regulator for asnA, asnC and gidA
MAIEKFPDIYDLKILNRIIENPEMPLSEIGKYALIASAPSISKRKKKLFSSGIIKRLVALLNYENLGFKYPVIIFITAKFGENYIVNLGEKLKNLPGTIWIYNISGNIDFIIYAVYRDRTDYLRTLDIMTSYNEIERTDTRQLHRIIKDMDFQTLTNSMIHYYNK